MRPGEEDGGNDRLAFEAWYAAHWAKATNKTQGVAELAAIVVTMRDGDKYHDGYGNDTPYLNHLWEGWQARSALAAPGAAAAAPSQDAEDAARYRWLRNKAQPNSGGEKPWCTVRDRKGHAWVLGASLDAVIDAARAAQAQGGA